MKYWYLLLLIFTLSACTLAPESQTTGPTQPASPFKAGLPDLGPAPELTNQVWLNTDAPLRLSELRGQVVLLDMWTYG